MSNRIACWLRGHEWGTWDPRVWTNIFGVGFRVRWCDQCGARQERAA